MAAAAPVDAVLLDQVEASDIVVVRGTYDHVEVVLGALDHVQSSTPYTTRSGRTVWLHEPHWAVPE